MQASLHVAAWMVQSWRARPLIDRSRGSKAIRGYEAECARVATLALRSVYFVDTARIETQEFCPFRRSFASNDHASWQHNAIQDRRHLHFHIEQSYQHIQEI